MRSFPPSSLLVIGALALSSVGYAKSGWGEACSQANSHLDSDTYALDTDCDAQTYCNANGTCAWKGCRKDIYPYGYSAYSYDQLPPLCPTGEFCPDEGDQCLTQVPIGGACQKNRDDECAPPDNYKDLAGLLNVNGTVCLNYQCYLANVTLGQTCVYDNTVYTAYSDSGNQYAFIISRDNCLKGFYCDGSSSQCIKTLSQGSKCTGNKECSTYNCHNGVCGRAADDPIHPAAWTYVLVALGIILLIGGIFSALWFTHRRSRQENQIKLEQYYNEQIAYRQSIMSMSHAKNSLLSLPVNTAPDVARQSLYRDDAGAGYSTAHEDLLPPNMRRDSTSGWSDSDKPSDLPRHDSDVLLMNEARYADAPARGQSSHFRG